MDKLSILFLTVQKYYITMHLIGLLNVGSEIMTNSRHQNKVLLKTSPNRNHPMIKQQRDSKERHNMLRLLE